MKNIRLMSMDLQFFADSVNNGVTNFTGKPIRGKRVLYFIQAVDAAIGSAALFPAWQTDGTTTIGGDNIDEQTKMGRIIIKSTDEHSIELTQYYAPDDTSIKAIEDAKKNGQSIKVWRVVVDETLAVAEGTAGDVNVNAYPAKFGYGLVDELSYEEGEDLVEVSYTLNIIGKLQDGTFPLSDDDLAMIDSLYEYQRPGETEGDYDDIQTTAPTTPETASTNATSQTETDDEEEGA